MFRTTTAAAAILGFAMLATGARAADVVEYKVSLDGKSPAQVHAAIKSAAARACNDVYSSASLFIWDARAQQACKAEAAQTAQAQADALMGVRAEARSAASGTR